MIDFKDVVKTYAGETILGGVSFRINPGDRVGVVGPNGAGKSTLFGIITGEVPPDRGTVSLPKDLRLGILRQHLPEDEVERPLVEFTADAIPELRTMHEELLRLEQQLHEGVEDNDRLDALPPRPAPVADRTSRRLPVEVGSGGGAQQPRFSRGGLRKAAPRLLRRLADACRAGPRTDFAAGHSDARRTLQLPRYSRSRVALPVPKILPRHAAADFARPVSAAQAHQSDAGGQLRAGDPLRRGLRLLPRRTGEPPPVAGGGQAQFRPQTRTSRAGDRPLPCQEFEGGAGQELAEGAGQDGGDRTARRPQLPRRDPFSGAAARRRRSGPAGGSFVQLRTRASGARACQSHHRRRGQARLHRIQRHGQDHAAQTAGRQTQAHLRTGGARPSQRHRLPGAGVR